ncbi:hypothetical protein [Streptomyces sp. GZWMJZ-114]|uniref:hypothetical protein n=1 Tax=Streptomyces sp. GZWMJZ-114 TaxID=2494734 RepID=UPI0010132241|nr:hypothetical protein [Streptomyces sp. GZWMJZ-114]
MAGFRSLARQARDPRADLALRRWSLRKCLEIFAPYGHRATWDHLCAHWGFGPEDRAPDPARLRGAVDELERAREVWLAYERAFAARRRAEKRAGLRRPGAVDDWHRRTWGGFGIAWCADPGTHPDAPLPEVLGRLIAALEREPGERCPVCGSGALRWREDVAPLCASCGITVPLPTLSPAAVRRARGEGRALVGV